MSSSEFVNWRRRLQGRALEQGLVQAIHGKKWTCIRMLRLATCGTKQECDEHRSSAALAVLSAMITVAQHLWPSLRAEVFHSASVVYVDQHVFAPRTAPPTHTTNGDPWYQHYNIDIRASWLGAVEWIEMKWGDLKFHRSRKVLEMTELQRRAQSVAGWKLDLPGASPVSLEKPRKVGYLIVYPDAAGVGWELYLASVTGAIPDKPQYKAPHCVRLDSYSGLLCVCMLGCS